MKHSVLIALLTALTGCWAGSNSELLDDAGVDAGPDYPVYFVDVECAQPGDGRSWETAFTSVQEGIDVAALEVPEQGVVHVWVAAGTYFVFAEGRTDTIWLASGVEVYGGFAGHESSLAARDIVANETVLDGRRDDGDGSTDRVYHVVTGCDDARLDGFTVRFGNAVGDQWPIYYGGGMYNYACSPTIANCRFERNHAEHGGGMYNEDDADALIEDCVFRQNTADGNGAGMRNSESSPEVYGCTFELNLAERFGGGMANGGGSPVISDCVFNENLVGTWYDEGGGMSNNLGTEAAISNTTFIGNEAWRGGGMSNHSCTPLVTDCDFIENHSSTQGGGAYVQSDPTVFHRCNFLGNNAARGGGVYASVAGGTIDSCSFFENRSMRGAAVFVNASQFEIVNTVFSRNAADDFGGGLYFEEGNHQVVSSTFFDNSADLGAGVYLGEDPEVLIVGSILWNDPTSEIGLLDLSAELDITHSDVQGGWNGAGNLDADPLFVDPAGDDFHLLSGSSCIDAADGPAAPELDHDGHPRVDDMDTPNTGLGPPWADIGAYEYQP